MTQRKKGNRRGEREMRELSCPRWPGKNGYQTTNIPSAEDFARAERHSAEWNRDIGKVCENVVHHFKKIRPFHDL
jgi:hypothetical protein